MIRLNLATATLESLERCMKVAEIRKKQTLQHLLALQQRLERHEITNKEFLDITQEEIEGRTLQEWITYYDEYITYCQRQIKLGVREQRNRNILIIGITVFFILALSSLIFTHEPSIQGLAVTNTPTVSPLTDEHSTTQDDYNEPATENWTTLLELPYLKEGGYHD